MKKIPLIFFALLVVTPAHSQQLMTMEQCMAYAANNANSVEQARWDMMSANADYTNAIADFLPSVSAQSAVQFSWGRNIDPETNTYNNVTTLNNGYGIYASMTIFDGGLTYNRWRTARAEKSRSRNAVDLRRDDSAIAAMMAYVDAVYYLGAIDIAADKLRQSESMLNLTRQQEELGIKGMPDVAQAEATLADDEFNLVHQRNLYQQTMLNLRSCMNYPLDEPLALDTTTFSAIIPEMQLDDANSVYSYALTVNPIAIEADLSVESSKYRYRMAQSALSPTISFNAGISTSYHKTLGSEYGSPRFTDQFKNNRGEYVSVSINIPLLDYLGRLTSVKKTRYALEYAKTQRDDRLRQLHDDILRAIMDRDGYAAEIRSMSAKVEADFTSYNLNLRKYEEGLLSLIDLQLSANTYYSSQLTLLQKQMLYILKDKLVNYYKGEKLY